MGVLLTKTRSGTKPQGKPRVYFCAHETDHTRWLDSISALILKHQNCAVWYWDDPTAVSDEETESCLSEMQLFVVPVTSAFLYTENVGRCRDLPFALDHHIPVLPLMVEAGLAADFNRICGNLQFLDMTAQDLTAISLEDKIAVFLQSVLVGDELASKVRAAFDAYVFLSYRKKDRRYALELMHLIHENEVCRDIAIWYDEFLVPGEDFDDAIAQALYKSQLFALVVTPNLVNEPNYVQEHEYPAALQSGKPVLAAELVKTDRSALEQSFEGIPSCTDVQDRAAFNRALIQSVSALALRQNDQDPQHNFFIGLAYLTGLDVEKNAARGVQLIESAAQAGLPEAMQKLITVYEQADGVPRDRERALLWHERLVESCQARYEQSGSQEDADKLLRVMGEWLHTLVQGDDRRQASAVIERLVKTAQEIRSRIGSRSSDRDVVLAQINLSQFLLNNGDLDAAKKLIDSVLEQAQALVWDENGAAAALDYYVLASCHEMRARVYEARGDLKSAELSFDIAIEISEKLLAKTKQPMFAMALGEAMLFFGGMLIDKKGDTEKAIHMLPDAIALLESVIDEMERPVVKTLITTNVIGAYLLLAQCEAKQDNRQHASAHAHSAEELARKLVGKEALSSHQRLLSMCYASLAKIASDAKERERYSRLERDVIDRLFAAVPVLENALPIAERLFEQGMAAHQEGRTEQAKAAFERVVELLSGFSTDQLCVHGGNILTDACGMLAEMLIEDAPPKALSVLKKALPLAEKRTEKSLYMAGAECYSLACFFYLLAQVYKALNKRTHAEEYAKKADFCYICIYVHMPAYEKDLADLQLLAEIAHLRGELKEEQEHAREAMRHYTDYLRYAEDAAKREATFENVTEVGVACTVLARTECAVESYDEAILHGERALEIFKRTYKERRERFLKDNIVIVKELLRTCKRKTGKGFLWF